MARSARSFSTCFWVVSFIHPAGATANASSSFCSPNESVINLDVIARFDLRAEIRAPLAVDGDAAFRDQLVATPARAEPRSGEEAIEAHVS